MRRAAKTRVLSTFSEVNLEVLRSAGNVDLSAVYEVLLVSSGRVSELGSAV